MSTGRVLLEDNFDFQTVPFMVKVEVIERFVHAKTGEMRSVCYDNTPKGLSRKTRNWVICDLVLCRVRPDYPYTIDEEWPENVDKHFHTVVALTAPKREWKWKVIPTYTTETERELEEIDAQALAKETIAKMKHAYENRAKVKTLDC